MTDQENEQRVREVYRKLYTDGVVMDQVLSDLLFLLPCVDYDNMDGKDEMDRLTAIRRRYRVENWS